MTTVNYRGFTLKMDESTGHGQVRRGVTVAHAEWNGIDLECPDLPDPIRFELEVALLGGETGIEAAS